MVGHGYRDSDSACGGDSFLCRAGGVCLSPAGGGYQDHDVFRAVYGGGYPSGGAGECACL